MRLLKYLYELFSPELSEILSQSFGLLNTKTKWVYLFLILQTGEVYDSIP